MASVSTVYIWSENLIKDLAFKERLGLKADLIEELVAVVQLLKSQKDMKKTKTESKLTAKM